ncbi:hypothetical protein MITS9509_01193 [Synechococcus sp. MIT S9509]|nr:hypothetical protein MITS9504_00759 [Synechococcus sp. MIT S9504]KZR92744.1 hypothetical protein MITS9509_01193 [Synechococcus sp. MIT S9509]
MELPKYTFLKNDNGLTEQWWKERIQYLLMNKQLQDADALYREFDVSHDGY